MDEDFLDNFNIPNKSGVILWMTGLSSSGKTTIALKLAKELRKYKKTHEHIDGDAFRAELNIGLSYSTKDRKKNIEIAAYLANKLSKHVDFVIVSLISPFREQRRKLKEDNNNFIEIYINAPINVCEERDVKGLYKKARKGEIIEFTGISHLYEAPFNPDIELKTDMTNADVCVREILNFLDFRNLI